MIFIYAIAHALKKDAPDSDDGLGWCGMFIYYCYSQAAKYYGIVLPFPSGNLWSGQKFKKWSLSHSDKIVNTCPILPGDIYVMNSYDIGMVIESVNDFSFVKTIDGNQSSVGKNQNSVNIRTRSFPDMRLLVRI